MINVQGLRFRVKLMKIEILPPYFSGRRDLRLAATGFKSPT